MKSAKLPFFSLALGALFGCVSAPPYRGPQSPHFDGQRFLNDQKVTSKSLLDVLQWQLSGEKADWPKWIESPQRKIHRNMVGEGEISVTFINHATTLIQTAGLNILTDPIWIERCSPFSWIGPKRVRSPGVRLEDLPPVHVILISHNHYDHLDIPTLRQLAERDRPLILSGLGNRLLLEKEGIKGAVDLDWWQSHQNGPLVFTFVPAQHFSGRGLTDRDQTLWGGFVVQAPAGPIYFAGDTGYGPHFSEIGGKYGPFQLAMIPIGAYLPRWFMKDMHINPQEAVQAHRDLRSQLSMGIHFGTFQLTDEAYHAPQEDLRQALRQEKVSPEEFIVLDFGETRVIPAAPREQAALPKSGYSKIVPSD